MTLPKDNQADFAPSRLGQEASTPDDPTHTIIEKKTKDLNGKITVKRYTKGRFLGKGGFAKVYELRDPESNQTLAVKVVQKTSLAKPRAKAKLQSEIRIHRSL